MARSSHCRLGPLLTDLLGQHSVALLHLPPVQHDQGPTRGDQQCPVHRDLVEVLVVGQVEAGEHAEAGHDLQDGVEEGEVVVSSGEGLEAGHEVEAGEVVTVAGGDVEGLEAGGERLTGPGVHHKVLSWPQQLTVNMELLQHLVLHQPLQHLDLVPGQVELPQLLQLVEAAHPGDLVVLEVEQLNVRSRLQGLMRIMRRRLRVRPLTSILLSLLL